MSREPLFPKWFWYGAAALGVGALLKSSSAASGARVWPVSVNRGILSGFGATREDGRQHAAADIGAIPGDDIRAISDGTVLYFVSGYSIGTDLVAYAIRHADADYIYAEIHANLKSGQVVSAGEKIGSAALNGDGNSMLHLEAWEPGMAPHGFTPWYTANGQPAGLLNVQSLLPKG